MKVLASHSMARTQSWRDDVRNGMQALILQNKGKIEGIWASFDGQAFIIDDLLREQGYKKGDVKLVSVDGGAETYRRIADPQSTCWRPSRSRSRRWARPRSTRSTRSWCRRSRSRRSPRARICTWTRCWSTARNVAQFNK